jgi:hypothetical protein
MSGISASTYTDVYQFAILSAGTTTGISFGPGNSVNNGYYGASGPIIGPPPTTSGSPSGQGSAGQVTAGLAQLGNTTSAAGTLVADIITYTTSLGAQTAIPTDVGGVITFLPNTNYYSAGIAFTSPVTTLEFNGSATDQFFITSGASITFTGITMTLGPNVNPSNIFWLAETGNITIAGAPLVPMYGNFLSYAGFTSNTASRQIFGNIFTFFTTGAITFAPSNSVTANGGPVVCYLKGSKILTPNGYTKVEDLNVGDLVVTKGKIHDNQYINVNEEYILETVTWIGNFRPANLNSKSLPICIKSGAFGENLPCEDLFISPGHRVILDGKMVLGSDLINGETIFQDCTIQEVEYYHFKLASHSSVVANGILTESYMDFNTSSIFTNVKQITHSLPLVETIMV